MGIYRCLVHNLILKYRKTKKEKEYGKTYQHPQQHQG